MDIAKQEPADLNTARSRDLAELPGIDRILARRIIVDRKLYGGFNRVEDLVRVEGVSPALVQSLTGLVKVQPPETRLFAPRLRLGRAPEPSEAAAAAEPAPPEPATFFGPPSFIQGHVVLRNEGEVTLQSAFLRLENSDLRTPHGVPLEGLRIPTAIAPGQQLRVTVNLQIDPTTPPGEYHAELVTADERQPIVVQVSENLSLAVSPQIVSVPNTPAARTERRIVVHNSGNVAVTIGDLGAAVVEERDVVCRVVRETVRKTEHPTWDEFVGTASDELKKSLAQVDPVKIRTKSQPVRLEPGQTAPVDLEIHNPKNARRGRRYVARLRLYSVTLIFELLPDLAEEEA